MRRQARAISNKRYALFISQSKDENTIRDAHDEAILVYLHLPMFDTETSEVDVITSSSNESKKAEDGEAQPSSSLFPLLAMN
jgi:hypothetical protein